MASNLRSSRVRAGSSAGEAVMLIHRPNVDTNLTWLMAYFLIGFAIGVHDAPVSFSIINLTLSEL